MLNVNPDMSESSAGVIETLKDSLQPESVANKFGLNKNLLMDVGVYGAIGFIVGFLLKKYSEYFISLVLIVVGIIVLQQFGYIAVSINSAKMYSALGLEDMSMTGGSLSAFVWDWAQTHAVSSASMVVGFLIGLKVG